MRTLYRHGRIYAPGVGGQPTAMLLDGATIAWIGDEHAAALYGADRVVELDGAFVAPAFVDAHVHTTATGLALTSVNLASCRSLAEAMGRVERAARTGRGRPIIGGGWDESAWPEGRPPTSAELDRAGYGGVVYLARVDVHSAVVSSSLLGLVPAVTSLAGYRPDGWLRDRAHDAARVVALSALTPGQIRDAQSSTLDAAAALGIACLHEMGGPIISSTDDFAGLLALARERPGPEVVGYWGELLGIDTARELGAAGAAGDLFCDGSIGSHTAAFSQPYADAPGTTGTLHHATEELGEHLVRCVEAGLQAGFHAIGDAAIEQVLDAVELASTRLGRLAGAGQRVEHAELVPDAARVAAAGLTASMQPAFDAAWGGRDGLYAARLGAARASRLNHLATLSAAGVPLALGSDAPVTPLDPWGAVRAAAYPHEPTAAISPRAAFTAHTRGGWRAAGRDGEGLLQPGAPATFAVWDCGDLGVDSPDERVARWSTDERAGIIGLPDLRPGQPRPSCRLTVRNGQAIFDARGSASSSTPGTAPDSTAASAS